MDTDMKAFLIGSVILFLGFSGVFYDLSLIPIRSQRADAIILEETGLDIQKVTINSPTFYVEFEEMSDFLDAVTENKATIIYTDGYSHNKFYVVFNEDYTIGYRIFLGSVLTHEKRLQG